MKILLITSHTARGFNNAPPLGLYRIRHQLQKGGFKCDVLDLSLSDPDYWIKCAASGMYKIIGFSVSHFYMKEDIRLIEKFKTSVGSHPCLFLAGGQEATFNYEQWLDCGIDGVVLGFGEEPMLQIAQSISKNNCVNVNSIFDISGTAYRNGGKTIVNTTKLMSHELFNYYNYDQVLELDIPFENYWDQAKNSIEAHKFLKSNFIPETVRLYTSSHCPNHCGFCSSHNFLSVSEGRKSPIFMLDAQKIFHLVLFYIKSQGAKGFLFSDDEFLMNRQRVISFCNMVINGKKSGLISQKIEFNCQARVTDFLLKNDNKNPDLNFILLLKEAGFHSIGLGVETFSDRLLQAPSLNKPGFSGKNVMNVINMMINAQIIPQINIILFVPDTTKEELLYNINKGMEVIQKGCTVAVTPHLYSIPGAPIYSNSQYPSTFDKIKCEITGSYIDISGYHIPHDKQINAIAEQFSICLENEIQSFQSKRKSLNTSLHKSILGILSFIVVAELLNQLELATEWRNDLLLWLQ